MFGAEMSATSAYSYLLKNTRTTFLFTSGSMLLVNSVMFLKSAFLALDISVIGH